MKQRALIPIVAATRAQLKGLVDHSFEGVAYGENSLREFSKLNLRAGELSVTSYSPNGVSNAGFANLQISQGSINGSFNIKDTTETSTKYVTNQMFEKFAFPACGADEPAEKIFNYLETWAKKSLCPLLKPGTQLTFLTIYEAGSVKVKGFAGDKEASVSAFCINRFLVPNSEAGETSLGDVNDAWKVEDVVNEGATSVNLINSDGDRITLDSGTAGTTPDLITIKVTPSIVAKTQSNCGGALILSRFENGTWKRSTASINIGFEPKYIYTYEDWLSVYQKTGAASKKYLNNGNEGTGIQG